MCLRIAEENNFLKVVQRYYDDDPLEILDQLSMYQQHHHLSVNYNNTHLPSLPFGLHVRSLLCFDLESPTSISCSFKVLRVLDFFEISNNHVVIGIEHLVHLRYLTISGILPPMESFHRLECLVVHSMDEIEIPNILLNMPSLRHMHFLGGGYFGASCLQQATNFESFQINNNLQNLKSAFGLPSIIPSDFLNQLESLKLEQDNLLFSLFSLPLNLKQLTLDDAYMSLEQMEIIGELEHLEVLKLNRIGFEGEQVGHK
ncbi:putative late blight resistance protein-like protein R1B-12 [Forsythia ovata]|uniref:Late blight resistance protein-like protein R1B-12 n=1 Tax=Forsythia ovata TaxID=205694 RepID=A0ABD1WP26_9LAMI